MKLNRTESVFQLRLQSNFDAIRRKLLNQDHNDCLEKPLAYWTVPADRRLPLAFMSRTVGEILTTPFDQLYATPGVGQKKIAALVSLLARVAATPRVSPPANQTPHVATRPTELPGDPGFDPETVSESLWQRWRGAIVQQGLENESLGRCVATLLDLPRSTWHTPLGTYTNLSLAEIRELKTHGEKRVRVVVETFGLLHRLLGEGMPRCHLAVRIMPQFILPIEAWINGVLNQPGLPDAEQFRLHLVMPLLEQVEHDAGQQIAALVASRLGVDGSGMSVKQAAEQLGLTRARVYQLLNEAASVLQVRWPEGASLFAELRSRCQVEASEYHDLELFLAAADLFFPQRRKPGLPLEPGSPLADLAVAHQPHQS